MKKYNHVVLILILILVLALSGCGGGNGGGGTPGGGDPGGGTPGGGDPAGGYTVSGTMTYIPPSNVPLSFSGYYSIELIVNGNKIGRPAINDAEWRATGLSGTADISLQVPNYIVTPEKYTVSSGKTDCNFEFRDAPKVIFENILEKVRQIILADSISAFTDNYLLSLVSYPFTKKTTWQDGQIFIDTYSGADSNTTIRHFFYQMQAADMKEYAFNNCIYPALSSSSDSATIQCSIHTRKLAVADESKPNYDYPNSSVTLKKDAAGVWKITEIVQGGFVSAYYVSGSLHSDGQLGDGTRSITYITTPVQVRGL